MSPTRRDRGGRERLNPTVRSNSATLASGPDSLASYCVLDRVFDATEEAVLLIDPGLRTIRNASPAAGRLFGFMVSELIGASARILHVSDESFREFEERIQTVSSGSTLLRGRYTFQMKSGLPLDAALVLLPLCDRKSEGTLVLCILWDTSEEEARAAELLRLSSELERTANDLAVLSLRSRSQSRDRPSMTELGCTPREIEIAKLAGSGLPSKQIAAELGISESTVKNYLSSLYRKLCLSSRVELVRALSERRLRLV